MRANPRDRDLRLNRRSLLGGLAASAVAASTAAGLRGYAAPFAPASAFAATPKKGGILRYGLSTDPPHIDPHMPAGYAAELVKGTIYSWLVRLNPKLEILPDLAESWERTNPTTFVFKLRKNVKWHDGSDFTSADVKATFDRIMDPKTGAWLRGALRAVEKVEVPDAFTVRFKLSMPDAQLLPALATSHALIANRALIEKGADLKTQVIGTGPFRLAERQPGVHLKLVRNAAYYVPDRIHLDGITFFPYPDDTSRTSALRTGAVDIIDYVPWKDMVAISNDRSLALHSDKDGGMMWIQIRVDKPPLNNPKVRQAIAWAIDRQAVLESVFFGRGRVLGGLPAPPWMLGYSPDRQGVYGLNVAKAKQLLAEAGVPNGFKINMLTTSTYAMHRNTGEVIQASLRKVGIDVNLELTEWATTVARYVKGDFELHVQGGGIDIADPAYMDQFYHSAGGNAGQTRFSDKQVDDLLNRARASYDPKVREKLYREAEARVLDLVPYVWMNTREQGEAIQASVQSYVHMPGANRSQHKVVEVWLNR